MRTHRWTLATVLLLVLLTGCGQSSPTGDAAKRSAQAPRSGDARASSGIDLAAMDHSVQPGDDFFSYANGTWVRRDLGRESGRSSCSIASSSMYAA